MLTPHCGRMIIICMTTMAAAILPAAGGRAAEPADSAGGAPGPGANLLANGDFSHGLDGWQLRPGTPDMVEVRQPPGAPGRAVHLAARDATLGLNSPPLAIGRDLRRDRAYKLTARVRFDGLKKGIAALSLCLYDRNGKRIRQYSVAHWSTRSKTQPWKVYSALIGAGAPFSFDSDAATARVRLSFYSRDGKCEGDIWLADVRITPAQSGPYATWPASILVDCGDVETRFESRSFWTLYRIDYRGKRLGLDRFGSHYGSVANFPGVGFAGSGHVENGETEQVEHLELLVDGKKLDPPPPHVTGKKIVLRKKSRIRSLRLETIVTVRPDRIEEEVALSTPEAVRVNLVYHFMHPWTTLMNRYMAVTLDGHTIEGEFVGNGKMKVDAPVRWSAVYSDSLRMGAVTRVVDAPADMRVSPWKVWYWDKDKVYRKHYFVTFKGCMIPAGRTFRYHIVTLPFESPPDQWKRRARALGTE